MNFKAIFIICICFLLNLKIAKTQALDSLFGTNGILYINPTEQSDHAREFALQFENKLLISGHSGSPLGPTWGNDLFLSRYNANGDIDTNFGFDGHIFLDILDIYSESTNQFCKDLKILEDESILLLADHAEPSFDILLSKFHPNGVLDSTFNGDGIAIISLFNIHEFVSEFVYLDSGKMIIGFSSVSDTVGLLGVTDNGEIDSTFAIDGMYQIHGFEGDLYLNRVKEFENKIYFVATVDDNSRKFLMGSVSSNGVFNSDFNNNELLQVDYDSSFHVRDFEIGSNEQLYLISTHPLYKNLVIQKFTKFGEIISDFGNEGIVNYSFDEEGRVSSAQVVILENGKIVVAGRNDDNMDVFVLMFNEDGTPDIEFGDNGRFNIGPVYSPHVKSMIIQQDNKILILGDSFILRFYPDLNTTSTINQPVPVNLNIYPNPTNDIISINFNDIPIKKGKIEILNQFGESLKTIQLNSAILTKGSFDINLNTFQSGIYYILFQVGKQVEIQKMVITK